MYKSENTTYQNSWDVAKAMLSGTFVALNVLVWEEENSQINDLGFCLEKLEGKLNSKKKNKTKDQSRKISGMGNRKIKEKIK